MPSSSCASFPARDSSRTIHTLPLIVAPIVVGSIWRLMTTPSVGIVPDYAKHLFGLDINMGRDAGTAFMFTVVMDIWHWTPLVTLTLLAALLSLPKEPFEQAQIDGASRTQKPSGTSPCR